MRFFHTLRSCLLLGTVVVKSLSAQPDHPPLSKDPTLDFNGILAATLKHAPESLQNSEREYQANAWKQMGGSLIAGVPSLTMNLFDDSTLSNHGQRERNLGVVIPLWNPGEKEISRQLGHLYTTDVALWKSALTLELAGRIRSVLADIRDAEAMLAIEKESTAHSEKLVSVTRVMVETGSLAQLDLMQAEHLLLEQKRRQLEAEAMKVDAERAYSVLTGLTAVPTSPHTETLVAEEEIEPSHPLLQYLQSGIALAQTNISQSEYAAKGNPQLAIGARRERGDGNIPYTNSINLSLSIPLGGKAFVDSRTSNAHKQKTEAEMNYLMTQRQLQQALHEAEHELYTLSQTLPLAEQQAKLGIQRQSMTETAFALGEITMAQMLPSLQEARSSIREYERMKLQQDRTTTLYNQIIGVMP